jgi:hypothetical protein
MILDALDRRELRKRAAPYTVPYAVYPRLSAQIVT